MPTLNVFDSGDSRTTTIVTQEPMLFEGNRVGDPRFHDKVSPSVMARWGTGGNNVPQILIDDRRVGPTIHTEVPTLQAFMGTGGNNIPMAFNVRSDDTNNTMDVYEAEQTTSLTALQPSPLSHRSQTFIAQRQSNAEYKMDDKASTISQRDYKSATDLVIEPIVRRLTPKECERLQGFPDDWTVSQADSSRYKMMGNAVTVPVVEWIIKRMVKLVSE